jgi:SAM-dependent MidA family methyltransferase
MSRDETESPGRPAIVAGIRRVPELDLDAPLPESNQELVARIAEEIRARGPMTFARFMELALYDPAFGYYASASGGATGPGRAADFMTAPEGHPIFGWSIARHLESVWATIDRPAYFVVREHGAGSGALAAGILDGLRRSGSPLLGSIEYQAADISPARLDALAARLGTTGLDRHLAPLDDRPAPGAILANELLDALPVHRVEGGPNGSLLERFVVLGDADGDPDLRRGDHARRVANAGRGTQLPLGTNPGLLDEPFGTALGGPSTPALAARLEAEAIRLEPGQPAEVCLAVDAWVGRAAAPLDRGTMLLIDYGYPAAELYAPSRGSTLRAYHRHRVHADPLVGIGRQDLTAHVDLTAVQRAADAAGLTPLGRTTQGQFLADLGAGELLVSLQTDPATTL